MKTSYFSEMTTLELKTFLAHELIRQEKAKEKGRISFFNSASAIQKELDKRK